MKLSTPYVWQTGLVALGVLSVVSLQPGGAQTATTTPSTGNAAVSIAGNGTNSGNGTDANAATGSESNGDPNHGSGKSNVQGKGEQNGGVDAQSIATFLGLTTEQVKADLDARQRLSQIAVAQGKTRDELKAFLVQQATASIDKAIDATMTAKTKDNGANAGANSTPASGSTTAPSVAATPATSSIRLEIG